MERRIIKHPEDVVPIITKYAKFRQEHFGIICLDSERKVISEKCLFIGSEHKSLIDTKMLFWYALSKKASMIIVYHNHPSGGNSPSVYDVETTENLNKACKIVGVQLLDHVIITKYSYFSFLEHNLVLGKDTDKKSKVAEV